MRAIAVLVLLAPAVWGQTLTNLKQLTQGGSNAEAYWSPNGKRIVFQSTRAPHACDQIYVMNADGSGQHMVSTGKGRTTCGYFLPDNESIVYASTHGGAAECPPDADRSKGYVWAVYDTYDIYTAKASKGPEQAVGRLTGAKGYDAEATVNFKTKKMVYTSLASGDLELWTMKLDGAGKKQITSGAGYDGGAVFNRAGTQIVWRANHPDAAGLETYRKLLTENLTSPMKMELYIADADGQRARQLTNYGCASFAPTFTPDGKQILFASNKHECDGRKFELFLINTDGTGLKQVTNYGGFTSFPEFSPDGKTLLFASDKGAASRYEFNIFTADWR
jgi:TolB protein